MNVRKLAAVGIFGSLAWVVSMFSFPILPAFSFLKVDFSDVILLLATLAYQPAVGVSAALVRSLLSYLVDFGEMGYPIGDTAAFIATLCFILPIAYTYAQQNHHKKQHLIGGLSGIVALTVVMTVLNVILIIPVYTKVLGISIGPIVNYVVAGVVPFNLIKGTLLFAVFAFIWPKIKEPIMKIRNR